MKIELLTDMGLDWGFIMDLTYTAFSKYEIVKSKKEHDKFAMWMMQHPEAITIMAKYDDEPAGYCIHSELPKNEIACYKHYFEEFREGEYDENCRTVLAIATEPRFKRKGLGKAMLEKTVEQCQEIGTKQIYATCTNGYRGSSLHLFKACGFDDIVTLPNVYPNSSDGTIVYKDI